MTSVRMADNLGLKPQYLDMEKEKKLNESDLQQDSSRREKLPLTASFPGGIATPETQRVRVMRTPRLTPLS